MVTQCPKNAKYKGTALICKGCRDRGCTSQNHALYTCTSCSGIFGTAKLDANSFQNFMSHGRSTVTCSKCKQARKARVKSLQKQLRRSKQKCSCFCLFHKALCPLSPSRKGEQRWPGSDGFISLNDKIFLDNLRPKPLWWLRASGRHIQK